MHHRSITAGHRPDQRPVARLPLTGPMTCTGDLVIKASTPAEQIGMQVPWDRNSYCRKRTLPKVQLVSFEIPEYNRMPTLISQNLSQKAVSESRTLANKVVRKSTRLHTCLHARHGAARPSTHSISRPRSNSFDIFPGVYPTHSTAHTEIAFSAAANRASSWLACPRFCAGTLTASCPSTLIVQITSPFSSVYSYVIGFC